MNLGKPSRTRLKIVNNFMPMDFYLWVFLFNFNYIKKYKFMETYLPIIAYAASGIILISFTMKDIILLRTLNTIGALMFLLYATHKHDGPVMFINGAITVINLFYIYKLTRK